MKVFISRFAGIGVCAAFAVLVITAGCTKKEQPQVAQTEEAQQPAPTQQTGAGQAPQQESGAFYPGTECSSHRYYVDPGGSASLTFEREINSTAARSEQDGEPSLSKEAMESAGYSVSYLSSSIDTFSVPVPIWTVSHPDFAKTDTEDGYKKTTYITVNGVSIDFRGRNDGVGVIVGCDGLTREQVVRKLGGKDTFDFTDARSRRQYSLSLEEGSKDREINILSVSMSIGVPSEKVYGEKSADLQLKSGGFNVSGKYDDMYRKYVITGPAKSRNCYQ